MAKQSRKKKASDRVIKDLKPARNPKGGFVFTKPIDKSSPIFH
jgi:type VI protein secretion system component Hcp